MKFRILKTSILIAVLGLIIWSCDGYMDQFSTERLSTDLAVSPSFAAPVAYGEFSLQDILETLNDESGLISLDDDSLMYIYFSDTLLSLDAGELLTIPDQVGSEIYIKNDIEIPAWFIIPEGTELPFVKKETLDFLLDPQDRIDSIKLKAGSLNLDAFSQFRHEGTLKMTSANIIDPNGDSLNIEFPISNSSGNYSSTRNYDLNGYTIVIDNSPGGSGQAVIYVDLTLVKSAAPIDTDDEAGINLEFRDIGYSAIYGLIAEREITDFSQEMDIPLFESVQDLPELYFADPEFSLIVHNSYGIPISLDIAEFKMRSASTGDFTSLEFKNDTMNPFVVRGQSIDNIGEFKTSTRTYNRETSNIDELLSTVPDKVEFTIGASAGSGAGQTEQNFLLDNSKISSEVEVILPMWFRTTGYTLQQTLDLDVADLLDQISFLDSAAMRLTTTNEWPFGLSLQVYFLDDDGNTVTTLFDDTEALLEAAPVNASTGLLMRNELQENPFDVILTPDDIDDMQGATQAMIEATIVTSDNGATSVKFISNYKLKYKLGVAAKFDLSSDNL